jgi:hypothetical protein
VVAGLENRVAAAEVVKAAELVVLAESGQQLVVVGVAVVVVQQALEQPA